MSANIIESFFVSLGFEIDTGKLSEFEKKLAGARSTVLAVGAVAASAAGAIGLFVTRVAEGIDELGDFAEQEQVSIEALQELGHAAQISGSSLDAVKSSVSRVNRTIGEAVLGIGRGKMAFEQLDLSAKNADGSVKTFDDLLGDVADKMQSMSRQEAIAMAEKLGLDRSLIPLLMKGRGELEKLREEARAFGVVSEADAQKAGDLTDALDRTKYMVSALGKHIAVGLMPQVAAVLDGFREWLFANREIIKSGINTALKLVTAVIGTLWDWIVRIADGAFGLVKWIFEFKAATYLAIAAVGALISLGAFQFFIGLASLIGKAAARMATFNVTALLIPAIIGAIILAIGLLIDSYVNWKEGNDSIIGDLVEQFPALLGIIKTIEDGVGSFIDFWLQQWDSLKGPLSSLAGAIWNLVTTVVGALWPVVKMVFTGWTYIMAAVIPIVASLLSLIIEGWANLASWLAAGASALVDVVTAIVEGFTSVFGMTFANIGDAWGMLIDLLTGNFQGAANHLMAIWDRVIGFWMAGFDKIKGAISWVGEKLGFGDSNVNISSSTRQAAAQSPAAQDQPAATPARQGQMTPIAQAVAQSPAMQNASVNSSTPTPTAPALQQQGGVIGRTGSATSNSTTVTQTTQVTGTTIQISSPDPAKAGEAVRQELDKMNKQTTRNGQSAVAL